MQMTVVTYALQLHVVVRRKIRKIKSNFKNLKFFKFLFKSQSSGLSILF